MQKRNGKREVSRSGVAAKLPQMQWSRWLPWIAAAYILLGGLFVAWAKMETTQLTYDVHQLRNQRAELQREQRLLDAELASLRSPAYLAARAAELDLVEPAPGVVRRVE